jgi:hypothetical protein
LAAFREVAFGAEGLAKGRAMKLLVNTPLWTSLFLSNLVQ